MFLFPLLTNINILFPISAINGFLNAILETVSCVVIIDVWGKDMGNYMQILYGAFGIGGLITPILIRPFQLPMPEEILDDPDAYLSYFKPEEVLIKYPYFGSSILSILNGIAFFLCYYFYTTPVDTKDEKELSKDTETKKPEQDVVSLNSPPFYKIAIAVMWVAVIGHLGFAMQLVFTVFAQAYGVMSSLRMEKRQAALIATIYWIAACSSKFGHILLSRYTGQRILNITCVSILSIGVIVCSMLANTFEICYWLVAMCLGLGFGPLFTVAYANLEKYFHLTGKHASCICIVFVLGESIHVPIVGEFMEEYPDLFLYYCATLGTLFVAVFVSFPYVCKLLFGDPEEARLREIATKHRTSRFGSVMIPVTDRRESVMFFSSVSPNPRRPSTNSPA
ncbi:sodium-dependent glucose transporter 1B-like isoform X2 [Brevipalpus obovatus]